MNNDVVIRAEGLGKKYVIGHESARDTQTTFRDVLERAAKSLARTTVDMARGRAIVAGDTMEEFWALKDVNFDIKHGEVVGIIGRNGAGKSTLLKILSRITEPSEGCVEIKGRVASLLEVGTGFHPELTGRENIYLNGAILGMTRAEIRRKFDEIVTFAEIEKFLDTPVKRYSSGMYVRLAFAVAAHLEPEILIVDEVLAVGDAEFQKKCLGKMGEVATGGRTVLFVSHNMSAVQSLCSSAFLLEQGKVVCQGTPENTVQFYSRNRARKAEGFDNANWSRTGTGEARILSVRLEDGEGNTRLSYCMGETLVARVQAIFFRELENPTFGINIETGEGIRVADCRSAHYDLRIGKVKGLIEYRVRIESLRLYPRWYSIEPWVANRGSNSALDWVKGAAEFEVTSGPSFLSGGIVDGNHGINFIPTSWQVSPAVGCAEGVA